MYPSQKIWQSRDRTNDRPSAPQAYQCSISHFLASLGAQENWYCTHIAHGSCQNRVSADQYHLTVSRAQVTTHPGRVFFKLSADKLLVFKWSQARVKFFLIHMKHVVFMCRTIKSLISNWPRTRKFSQLLQAAKTVAFDFSHHGHALITLYVQFLCFDWSKFDRWVHAENCAASWNLFTLTAEADRVLCQLVMF